MLEQIAVVSLWLACAYMIIAFKLGVFGLVTPCWNKGRGSIPDESTFFDRRELYVEDYSVAAIAGGVK